MAPVLSDAGDRILWTTLLVGAVASYWYIPQLLEHVKHLAAVKTPKVEEIKPRLIEDAEDAIEPSTIEALAFGPSYPVSSAAVRLAARKAIKDDDVVHGLLADLASQNKGRRERAIKALQMLLTEPVLRESNIRKRFLGPDIHDALVAALVNVLPDHNRWINTVDVYTSPIKPPHRSGQEAALMSLILNLMEEPSMFDYSTGQYQVNAQPAINSGIITKWLKRYPFPCAVAVEGKYNFCRHDVVRLLKHDAWASDDLLMSRLVGILGRTPQGWQELTDVGLKSRSDEEHLPSQSNFMMDTPGFAMTDGVRAFADEDDEDDEDAQGIDTTQEPLVDPSIQAQAGVHGGLLNGTDHRQRQRRHRETIVVSDSEGTLNILQPSTSRGLEQEVIHRQEELLRPGQTPAGIIEEAGADQIARERIDGLNSTAWTPSLPLLTLTSEFDADEAETSNQSTVQ